MFLNLQCGIGFPTTQLIRFIYVLVVYSSKMFPGDLAKPKFWLFSNKDKNLPSGTEHSTLLTEMGERGRSSVADAEQEGLNLGPT